MLTNTNSAIEITLFVTLDEKCTQGKHYNIHQLLCSYTIHEMGKIGRLFWCEACTTLLYCCLSRIDIHNALLVIICLHSPTFEEAYFPEWQIYGPIRRLFRYAIILYASLYRKWAVVLKSSNKV